MLYELKGNLLTSPCTFIIHQSNCLGGFGSGIAGQIRYKYPAAFESFTDDKRTPLDKLGDYSYAITNNKIIFNLYGQYNFGGNPNVVYTNYEAFEMAFDKILTKIASIKKQNMLIGMPRLIGCDRANGDWNIIYNIIKTVSDKHNLDIYLYEYNPK